MKNYLHIAAVAGVLLTGRLRTTQSHAARFAHRGAATLGAGAPDLSRLTVKELRAMATRLKIKGRSKARRKADLVKLIASQSNGGAR
jgi:hypothetical protein